jgi:hypothetical protein
MGWACNMNGKHTYIYTQSTENRPFRNNKMSIEENEIWVPITKDKCQL